jgi:hypothetical protein
MNQILNDKRYIKLINLPLFRNRTRELPPPPSMHHSQACNSNCIPPLLSGVEGQLPKIKPVVVAVFECLCQWLLHLQSRFVPLWITKVPPLNLTRANPSRHAHNKILRSRLILRHHPVQTMTYQASTKFKYESLCAATHSHSPLTLPRLPPPAGASAHGRRVHRPYSRSQAARLPLHCWRRQEGEP